MLRVIIPLIVAGTILFGDLYRTSPSYDPVQEVEVSAPRNGYSLLQPTIDCWRKGTPSISGECAPKGDSLRAKGLAVAVAACGLAAALGLIGFLPLIGRAVGAVAMLAGLVVIGAIGYFVVGFMGTEQGLEGISWGSYAAGGGGLVTLISGLMGMRGRD